MPTARYSETAIASAATLAAVAVIAQQVAGRATRDAVFLTTFPIEALPRMMAVAALVSLPLLVASSRWMTRVGPRRVVPAIFLCSSILFGAEWVAFEGFRAPVAVFLYLHLAAFAPLLLSGFWLLVNERFDPHSAKRYISRIAAGATLGGVVGGLLAERVSEALGSRPMLLLLAALNLIALLGVWFAGRSSGAGADGDEVRSESAPSMLRILVDVPYLRNLAVLVATVAATSALLDYVLRAEARSALASEQELLRFFALFYMGTSVASLVLNSLFGRMSLKRLGLAGTVALLPGALLGGSLLGFLLPSLWRAVAVRGLDAILQNSLFRSGYELLYTPLSPRRRRPTKSIIDVGFDRAGQLIGSVIALGVVWAWPGAAIPVLLGLVVLSAIATLSLSLHLQDGYVAALEESLELGSVNLGERELIDDTTRTIWESSVTLSRARILRAIAEADAQAGAAGSALPGGAALAAQPQQEPFAADQLLADVVELRSGEVERIRLVLRRQPLAPELVPLVIPLLANDGLAKDAMRALRRVAPQSVGQMVDALLDPGADFAVRRRLPRVLKVVATQRAFAGLFDGLTDRQFDVRHHCARALLHIVERNPQLRPPPEQVFAAARREIEVSRTVWNDRELIEVDDDDATSLDDGLRQQLLRRSNLSLQHVFTILALALDRGPLELAFAALSSDQPRFRGTALEYLDNVLPVEMRTALRPYLGGELAARPPAPRPRQEILADLASSSASLTLDMKTLARRDDDVDPSE